MSNNDTGTAKLVTLKDVARAAGVSAMTVSNALNNKEGVSEETRKRILGIAHQLNYSPNQVAQSLRSAKTNTIGVVMSDSSQYTFSKLLRGIEHGATGQDYSILLANTDQKRDAEIRAIDLLASKRIDGLLLAAPLAVDADDIQRLNSLGVPFVFLMRTPEFPQVDYVSNDNFRGGCISIGYLYEGGERDFAFLALDSTSGRERLRGCRHYLEERGLGLDDYPVLPVPPQIEDGHKAMVKLLREGFRKGVVICGCDMIAVGAMDAICGAGLDVPGDIRLIGYDDFDMAPYLRVPLTTVRQPVYQIGAEGFRVLMNRIDHPNAPYQSVILQPELVIRDSTGNTGRK